MGIRENLGLRVGWMLGFVDSWLLASERSESASPRAERVQVDEGDWKSLGEVRMGGDLH